MIIREHDVNKLPPMPQAELEHAQEILNNWAEVSRILDTEGWRILEEYFQQLFAMYDSVSGCTEENFLYRKGLCDGIAKLTQTPKVLKRMATSAQEKLKAGLAEHKE